MCGEEDDEDDITEAFSDAESFYEALRAEFSRGKAINFHGSYTIPYDPTVSPRQRVQVVSAEIWNISHYRFTTIRRGHRTRLWCSQDEARKKKSKASQNPDIRNHDNVGMKRFPCGSKLSIRCQAQNNEDMLDVMVQLKHAGKHVGYVDVSMPVEALDMIRENIEWLTPVAMVTKVQAAFPSVTAAQIHRAWMEESKPFWRFDNDQLLSTKKLLEEHTDDIDIFELTDIPEGLPTKLIIVMEIIFKASNSSIPQSKSSENENILFAIEILRFRFGPVITGGCAAPSILPSVCSSFHTMPRVAQSASHQHRGSRGMFTPSQPTSGNTESDLNDDVDNLWETDTESDTESDDYFEAWEAQPKLRTYDECEERRLEKREKAAAKHRAVEMQSAENREGGALNKNAGAFLCYGI
ncbi:hypothetical protein B0H10DRAFT_1947572 [Mycena sp. CBHHK59/15]|nr:hypothetical protein B0H10DRAFT_1947572 [Mycena sp. CBHHK59/15]